MPLPLLLVGGAILVGGSGAKKGIDAHSDFSDAKDTSKDAQRIHDSAYGELENSRLQAQNSLESLGGLKFNISEDSIIPFVDVFSQIKNIDFDDSELIDGSLPSVNIQEMEEMKISSIELKEIVSGGVSSLGAGGLAGFAAYGGVGFLGTASTGTGIAGLSGAAATNATMAWLGGGSLATGGFGMAGGMVVLGGIVAAPVLAVGGMMVASKAEAAKHDAITNLKNAEIAAEEMYDAGVVAKGIQKRLDELNVVLSTLNESFMPLLDSLRNLVGSNTNYQTYSKEDKEGCFITASLAKTLKNLLEVEILNESGTPTEELKKTIDSTNKLIEEKGYDKVNVDKRILPLESFFERYEYTDDIHNGSSLYYTGYRAPYKKISNAEDSYAFEDDDHDDECDLFGEFEFTSPPEGSLVLFYDHTLFGSGDSGFYLTDDKMYAMDYKDRRICITLKDIEEPVSIDETDHELKIGGSWISYDSDLDRPMGIIADCINSYIEQFKSEH